MTDLRTLATGEPLTADTFADFKKRLTHHLRGDGVTEHYTANALYIVQARRLSFGIDTDYTDNKGIVGEEGESWTSPADYFKSLEAEDAENLNSVSVAHSGCAFNDLPESEQFDVLESVGRLTITGWSENWEYINAHFTKEAAEAFIERKKHGYKHGLRVYAESQHMAWEFKTIVNAIMDGKLVLADQEVSHD